MRALLLDYAARGLRVDDGVAEPPEGEVYLRVLECGICGTDRDLAAFAFGAPPVLESALILGHEAVAVVERSTHPGLRPGDYVVPSVRRACSEACASCAAGRRDLCLTGGYRERGILGLHGYCAEWAVDRAEDLFAVPASLVEVAVLVEPMSVVEKPYATALRLHLGEPGRVVILGAGTVGILAAWAGLQRGWDVTVVSREPGESFRANLLRKAGVSYRDTLPGMVADVVIEACGSAALASAAIGCLKPLGVMIVLGARNEVVPLPFLDLIVGNRILAGSVNAAPEDFRRAISTLAATDSAWLRAMIERRPLSQAVESITSAAGDAIKVVHRLH